VRVLITGGAGFIGSHLAEALIKKGHQISVVDDLSTGKADNVSHLRNQPGFQLVVDTILNEATVDKLIEQADLVYHLAAAVGVKLIVAEPVKTIETNIRGSEVVLKFANKWRRPVVIASTSEIYGKGDRVPYQEVDDMVLGATFKSRWSYACSKAIDEFLALAYFREKALPVIVLRLFNTVGPRQVAQYGMVLPTFVKQALLGKPLTVYGDGKQSRTFCSIYDVVRVMIDVVQQPKAWGEVYNLGSQEEISIIDLAHLVIRKTGGTSPIQYVSYDEAYEMGFEDMRRRVPDVGKLNRLCGFVPQHNVEEIVDQVIAYYRDCGPG
jgi:UDP-glucose 4-epimerase